MKFLKDKILLITGGTGSFGNAVLDKFLHSDLKEIRILFSIRPLVNIHINRVQ